MNYFTSDQHFGHENIIKYCGRDTFKNSHQMDKTIIDNYNSVVTPNDTCYILGDFTMTANLDVIESLSRRLNGNKVLILGNHDRLKPFTYVDIGFSSVHTSLKVRLTNGEEVICIHDPAAACGVAVQNKWLVGHVHNLFKSLDRGRVTNVGVDVFGFLPVSEDGLMLYWDTLKKFNIPDTLTEDYLNEDYHVHVPNVGITKP